MRDNKIQPLRMTDRFKPGRPKTDAQKVAMPDIAGNYPLEKDGGLTYAMLRKGDGPVKRLPVGGSHSSIAQYLQRGWELA